MIVIGTTIAPWKCGRGEELAWLDSAEGLIHDGALVGEEVKFFAALEVDARGRTPYDRLLLQLEAVQLNPRAQLHNTEVDYWTFSLDDHAKEVTTRDRLIRITTGRNLIREYAMRTMASHILFVDSDLRIPANSLTKLLEIDHPVVGGSVPLYALDGPKVEQYPDLDVREHWNTAGFLLVRREVFSKVLWRWSLEDGMSDDPCFQNDQQVWGFGQTWVRHDVVASALESYIVPVESRPVDRTIYN